MKRIFSNFGSSMRAQESKVWTAVTHRSFTKGIKEEILKKFQKVQFTKHKKDSILSDSFTNKYLAFSKEERERLGLRGLLPPTVLTMKEQADLKLKEFNNCSLNINSEKLEPEISDSGIKPEMVSKWKMLFNLYLTDESLFYYLLTNNMLIMAPIVYTPTVGWACKNYSKLFSRMKGLYITMNDKGQIPAILENWNSSDIDVIVATDGSRILGLGDLGIGGIAISIGKSNLYVAAGGIHPRKILPVVFDVGTNNESLLKDPSYLGVRQYRADWVTFYSLIEEFLAAVFYKWPNALIQFEDFSFLNGMKIIQTYGKSFKIFDDDIQGTASVVLAGIIGALKIQNLPTRKVAQQRFLVVGAGNVGIGIAYKLHLLLQKFGIISDQAAAKFWLVDKDGLITKTRNGLSKEISLFAREEINDEGMSLLDVIRKYKITCLIGVAGKAGLFTEEVLSEMANCQDVMRPMIFALSSPNSKAECTAEDAQKFTNHQAIFSSLSIFPDVISNQGVIRSNYATNIHLFPGLTLGSVLGQVESITDSMIISAAEGLAECLTSVDAFERSIYPNLSDIRETSVHIAAKVMEQADNEGQLGNPKARKALNKSFDELKKFIRQNQWYPEYKALVHKE